MSALPLRGIDARAGPARFHPPPPQDFAPRIKMSEEDFANFTEGGALLDPTGRLGPAGFERAMRGQARRPRQQPARVRISGFRRLVWRAPDFRRLFWRASRRGLGFPAFAAECHLCELGGWRMCDICGALMPRRSSASCSGS